MTAIITHPHVIGQCEAFLRRSLAEIASEHPMREVYVAQSEVATALPQFSDVRRLGLPFSSHTRLLQQ